MMANSFDWIAQASETPPASSEWIAALISPEGGASEFTERFPFATRSESQPAEQPVEDEADLQAQAYERGVEDGRFQARSENEAAIEKQKGQLRDLRLSFRALDQVAREAFAQDLNATVVALCEQVLIDYAADSDALLARCEKAAARLGSVPSKMALHLHPETRAGLAEGVLEGWSVHEDSSLEPGALRLGSSDGTVYEGPAEWKRAIVEALDE